MEDYVSKFVPVERLERHGLIQLEEHLRLKL